MQYNTYNNTDEHKNTKYNITYQLKQVTSASNSLLVTSQDTQIRLTTSDLPVTLRTLTSGKHQKTHESKNSEERQRSNTRMLTFCPVTSNPVRTG